MTCCFYDSLLAGSTVVTLTGRGFGEQWYTSYPTYVGTSVTGKIKQTDTEIQLLLTSLEDGDHEIKVFIEGRGVATKE